MNAEHDHRKGPAGCPVCSKHDHTNTTPFALDRGGHELPGWFWTCQKCGTADAQHLAERGWTKEGLAWMRAQAS